MLAIAGGKGGSGKTTTTACLARALVARDREPIVVDGDCDMPDLHLVAGTPAEPGIEALAEGAELPGATHSAVELPGVDVLPAGIGDAAALEQALDRLQHTERHVLVDTPAGASPAVATALRVADGVLVVTTPTRESLEDAAKTVAMARRLDATPLGTVVTRCDDPVDPSDLLDCPTLVRIPEATRPLTNDSVASRYQLAADEVHKRNI